MERLPWRVEGRLALALGMPPGDLEICPKDTGELPSLRCVLSRPATTKVSMLLRVHSRAGIPLAHATIVVNPGDRGFETPLAVLAMEGYAHLGREERLAIERRVWLRRSFATGSAV
jgi:hypothetical protein